MLGAAQLGMDYGIANRNGRPDRDRADAILAAAWTRGVRTIDTAQAYGDSEAVIGDFLARHPQCDFEVITKLRPGLDADGVADAVDASRRRIGRTPSAVLLHDAGDVERWDGAFGAALRGCAAVEALGVSLYTPEQFERALGIADFAVIQAPFNALDRRLAETGLLARARSLGKRVFLRSAYLQGLLLMDPADLPAHMAFAADALAGWRALCADHGMAPAEAALRFVRAAGAGAAIVVGCETPGQLEANLDIAAAGPAPADFAAAVAALPPAPERLINPSLWTT